MLDKKIIYRDPKEREISHIIDISDKSKKRMNEKTGNYKGRDVQQLAENKVDRAVKKLRK